MNHTNEEVEEVAKEILNLPIAPKEFDSATDIAQWHLDKMTEIESQHDYKVVHLEIWGQGLNEQLAKSESENQSLKNKLSEVEADSARKTSAFNEGAKFSMELVASLQSENQRMRQALEDAVSHIKMLEDGWNVPLVALDKLTKMSEFLK